MHQILIKLSHVLTRWAPREFTQETCEIWIRVLKDYSDDHIKQSFLKAVSFLSEFPSPSAIRSICAQDHLTDEQKGQDAASRIEGAIRRYGYNNPSQAESFIGPLGWTVVNQCGGWDKTCDIQENELLSLRKQWRETAVIISKNLFHTGENLPPEIPQKSNPKLSEALKIIAGP